MTSAKILVVEDEGIVALDIQTRLKRLGYVALPSAATAEEALTLTTQHQPDLILMDIRLKGEVDGIQAAELIRERFQVPIIYLTAYSDEETLQRAKITEPYGYLTKPFDERELQIAIEITLYRHTAQVRVREHARQLQQVINTVPEGMILLNANSEIVLANTKGEHYLTVLSGARVGEQLSHLGGLPLNYLLSATRLELWHELAIENPIRQIFEVAAYSIRFSKATGTLNSQTGRWVMVIRDVTQERASQERAFQQERLAIVGRMAGGIAHDFNNILSSIMLIAEAALTRDHDLSSLTRQNFVEIVGQTHDASYLVQQIMDFSRKSPMKRKPINLLSVLHNVTQVLEHTLPENIRLSKDIMPGEYIILADAARMHQVIVNLALNGRDSMPEGGTLHLHLDRVSRDTLAQTGALMPDAASETSDWIRMILSDTGQGIPNEALPHIFEPFFTTKERGQGMGLAQVYGIIQQHDSIITVSTQPGLGTSFTIYLPAHPGTAASVALGNPYAMLEGHGEHLLLVEDNHPARTALCDLLELSNYRVSEAANGLQALKVIEQADPPIDLVISDLIMPEMGGVEFLHVLKERHPQMKFIVMTGYAPDEWSDQLLSEEIDGWLQKPADWRQLSGAITRALYYTD